MGQLISTILVVIVLLIVPLGVVQLHATIQMRTELIELSVAVEKHVSNHGGTSDRDVLNSIRQVIRQELQTKVYKLNESDVSVEIIRTKANEPILWSHDDEFQLRLVVPSPRITSLFTGWGAPITIERRGTINVMDYDL